MTQQSNKQVVIKIPIRISRKIKPNKSQNQTSQSYLPEFQ